MVRSEFFIVGKNAFFDKLFILSIFCHYVLSFLLPQPNQFILRIAPLVIGVVIYLFIFLLIRIKIKKMEIIPLILITCFSFIASLYLIWEKGFPGILSMENFFFLSLPLLFIAAGHLNTEQGLRFTYNFFMYYICFQLFVLLGQAMKMLTGIGFNTPAEYSESVEQADYSNMLSGTFLNSNDLACLVVMIAVFFLLLKKHYNFRIGFGLIVISIILILTVSRVSILLYVVSLFVFWFASNRVRLSKMLSMLLIYLPLLILILSLTYILIENYSDSFDALYRIKMRIDTIFMVLENGISADNSMSLRFTSYINFINNLTNLGYGTIKLRDYGIFVSHLGPNFDVLALNPHSFIVEIGYWMGWLGLFLFTMFMLSLLVNNITMLNLFVFIVFVFASMISSSVINNFLLFYCFFCCSLISKIKSRSGRRLLDNHHHVQEC